VIALQQLLTLARDAGDRAAVRHWTDRLVEADPELAAELSAPAGDGFEPLDLEQLPGGRAEPFAAAALDPRLAVAPADPAVAGSTAGGVPVDVEYGAAG
jgi:hypothetical protein